MFRNQNRQQTARLIVTYHIGYTVNTPNSDYAEPANNYKPIYRDVEARDKARLIDIHTQLSDRANEIAGYRNTTQHLHVKVKGFVNGKAIPNFETHSLSELYDFIQSIQFAPTLPRRKWGVELRM
tara:strand:- start:120 stop:494 length:375 start_codon:yes stop_codon:yes gene_type:complete